jgi:hypothetical protein
MSSGSASALHQAPIEAIWIAAAREIGWSVVRTSDAFATSDGRGTIAIGVDEVLDADDAVAQLVFHELCHGLVQGPERWSQPDWGLSNTDARDVVAEHACLRVQIHLAARHGLRAAMAPTTEYRAYHDAVTGDPLLPASDPAAVRAREALERGESGPWIAALERALGRTRLVLDGASPTGQVQAGGAPLDAPAPRPEGSTSRHPTGFPWGPAEESCGGCAWLYVGGRGPAVERCRQAGEAGAQDQRVSRTQRACERWEPPVACQTCGACCREAYHSVTVSVRDPVVWKQPALIVRHGHRFEILRTGPRCAALQDRREDRGEDRREDRGEDRREDRGEDPRENRREDQGDDRHADRVGEARQMGAATETPAVEARTVEERKSARAALVAASSATLPTFACTIYEDRPRACREFEAGGRHCLVARRRVGLSV